MTVRLPITSTAALFAALAAGLMAPPAQGFTIARNSNPNALLEVLLGNTTGLSNLTASAIGDNRAFGTFESDPFGLGAGIILSTGNVNQVQGVNQADNAFQSGNGVDVDVSLPGFDRPGQRLYDITQFRINFDVDETVDTLFFEYVFGSEEFPEYAGTRFNDLFRLELNGQNLARLTHSVGGSGRAVSVNNLAASPSGPFSRDYVNNPRGSTKTKLDGYTRPLTFTGTLQQGTRNTLNIFIADVADQRLDSAVFVKAGTLGTVVPSAETEPPAVTEPVVVIGPEVTAPTEADPVTPPEPPVVVEPTLDTADEAIHVPEPTFIIGLLLTGLTSLGFKWAKPTSA